MRSVAGLRRTRAIARRNAPSHRRNAVSARRSATAAKAGLPLRSMGASLGYYDRVRRERLPANPTQAQRDFFGVHTYRRIGGDKDIHTEWEPEG